MDWVDLLSFTATCSTIGLFLCGMQIIFRIHNHGTTEGTGIAPFLLTAISCAGWTGYGVLRNDGAVIFVNGIGLAIQSLYLVYYYRMTHYPRKVRLKNMKRYKSSEKHYKNIDTYFTPLCGNMGLCPERLAT